MGSSMRASALLLLLLVLLVQPPCAVSRSLKETGTNSADSDGEGDLIGSERPEEESKDSVNYETEYDLDNDVEGEEDDMGVQEEEAADDDKDVEEEDIQDEEEGERGMETNSADSDGEGERIGSEGADDESKDGEEDEEDDKNKDDEDDEEDDKNKDDEDDEEDDKNKDDEEDEEEDIKDDEDDEDTVRDDDDDDDNERDSDDGDNDDDGDDETSLDETFPPCFRYRAGWTYEGRSGKRPAKKYDDAEECADKCYCDDCGIDFVVWDAREERCECWKDGDGAWERSSRSGVYTFELSTCFPEEDGSDDDSEDSEEDEPSEARPKSPASVRIEAVEPQGWWVNTAEMPCGPLVEFLVMPNFACVTQSYRTINKNDTFYQTNDRLQYAGWSAETKWQNAKLVATGQYQYDGTYEACMQLFRLNHYNKLYWDIGARAGSWFTHDKGTQECRLYDGASGPVAQQCQALRYAWGMTVGTYCNPKGEPTL